MTSKQTWFITGAGRGMGLEFAKAALTAGHQVVATGRNPDAVARALGDSDELLVVQLDVTSTPDAQAAVKATVDRFGAIDVLVNNAASFYAGYFEELTARAQMGAAAGARRGREPVMKHVSLGGLDVSAPRARHDGDAPATTSTLTAVMLNRSGPSSAPVG